MINRKMLKNLRYSIEELRSLVSLKTSFLAMFLTPKIWASASVTVIILCSVICHAEIPIKSGTFLDDKGELVVIKQTQFPGIFSIEFEKSEQNYIKIYLNVFQKKAAFDLDSLRSNKTSINNNFSFFGESRQPMATHYLFQNGGRFTQMSAVFVLSFSHKTNSLSNIGYTEHTTAGIPILSFLFPIKTRTESLRCNNLMQIDNEVDGQIK
jgi:hypothetical protein